MLDWRKMSVCAIDNFITSAGDFQHHSVGDRNYFINWPSN